MQFNPRDEKPYILTRDSFIHTPVDFQRSLLAPNDIQREYVDIFTEWNREGPGLGKGARVGKFALPTRRKYPLSYP
jgi:hypothetical protein